MGSTFYWVHNNMTSFTKKRKFEHGKHVMGREIQLTCDDNANNTSIYVSNADQLT